MLSGNRKNTEQRASESVNPLENGQQLLVASETKERLAPLLQWPMPGVAAARDLAPNGGCTPHRSLNLPDFLRHKDKKL